MDHTRRNLILGGAKPKHQKNLKVKLGHGGTLDPLATGVLIVGVGRGTKLLPRFLECTKSYECVVLFGAATDSYDAVGKVVSRADHGHITRELVEERLHRFRGKIMQKPSVFSALKVDGKKMYEYAREGGDIPEVAARPVEVESLELVEWLEPGKHEYAWPKEEMGSTEQEGAINFTLLFDFAIPSNDVAETDEASSQGNNIYSIKACFRGPVAIACDPNCKPSIKPFSDGRVPGPLAFP